jgi:glutathione S-transferase
MKYIDVRQARTTPGLKLVLTAGVPGPWSEAIKMMLEFKRITYIPVIQHMGQANDDLVEWVGVRTAPVIVNGSDAPLTGWADMLMFAERSAPNPPLLPEDSASRAAVFGILNELAGEWGFGWCRRLMTFKVMSGMSPPTAEVDPVAAKMVADFKVSPDAWTIAPKRVAAILRMLSERLQAQKRLGSAYLVGQHITAADIYWAAFSAQLDPMPVDVNPMPDMLRGLFKISDPLILEAADPILLTHRDSIFKNHLSLPLDF